MTRNSSCQTLLSKRNQSIEMTWTDIVEGLLKERVCHSKEIEGERRDKEGEKSRDK